MSSNNLSRAGSKPGQLGLSGNAGLQLGGKQAMGAGGAVGGGLSMSLGKSKRPMLQKPPGAFASAAAEDDDLDDDASERARVRAEIQRSVGGGSSISNSRAAVEAAHAAALQQDASIFDYDGAYDNMQQQRSALRQGAGLQQKQQKEARYIGSIMKAHEARKFEDEKIFERRLVKEAEAEAHLYGDKEKFMTSAYRRKLEEREEYEAELRRREAEEARDDVTKRDGLGDFYSNLVNGKMAGDAANDAGVGAVGGRGGSSAARVATRDGDAGGIDSDGRRETFGPPASVSRATGDVSTTAATTRRSEVPPQAGVKTTTDSLLAGSISEAVTAATTAEFAKPEARAAMAPNRTHSYNNARRNDAEAVERARERYFARKRLRKAQEHATVV